MAKMEFYSQEEAATKLGVDEAALKQLVSRGELQPFRDRDKLLFKRQQVDALAARDESMGDSIGLSAGTDEFSLDETGTLGNLSLGETGDLSIAGGDDTALLGAATDGDGHLAPLGMAEHLDGGIEAIAVGVEDLAHARIMLKDWMAVQ